jgi:prepilin signal peptidase PulO-like enzyme (type II secretory pathway)
MMGWVLMLTLMKLSLDDLKTHWVSDRDLGVLCVCGLFLFKSKSLQEWIVILLVILGLAIAGKLRHSLGSGDLGVILSMGLLMDLNEFLAALQSASLMALLGFMVTKKALQSEVPFVPYLYGGILIVYLIRLRLIFS